MEMYQGTSQQTYIVLNDPLLNPGWTDRRSDKENLGHYVTKEEATDKYKEMIKTKVDYLGATPLHKAALKGNFNVTNLVNSFNVLQMYKT